MTNPTPRTRKQLRHALEDARHELEITQSERERAQSRAGNFEAQMDAANWPRERPAGAGIWLGGEYPHIPGEEFARRIAARETAANEKSARAAESWANDLRTAADLAREEARRSTLAAVIKALQITGYGVLTTAILNRPETQVTHHATDHFWADIQTALEVREEKRAADERAATEKKVAGLAPGQQLSFFTWRDDFDITSPRMSDLAFARDLHGRVTLGFDPAAGGSYGSAPRVDETAPKKPAKKKSGGKK